MHLRRLQATMELLFFASVGDPERCRVICDTWDISVADRTCCRLRQEDTAVRMLLPACLTCQRPHYWDCTLAALIGEPAQRSTAHTCRAMAPTCLQAPGGGRGLLCGGAMAAA